MRIGIMITAVEAMEKVWKKLVERCLGARKDRDLFTSRRLFSSTAYAVKPRTWNYAF